MTLSDPFFKSSIGSAGLTSRAVSKNPRLQVVCVFLKSSKRKSFRKPSYVPPITAKAFLEVAKRDANLPYLNGRQNC